MPGRAVALEGVATGRTVGVASFRPEMPLVGSMSVAAVRTMVVASVRWMGDASAQRDMLATGL